MSLDILITLLIVASVLGALASAGKPITPSEISDATGRSPNAISPLLRGLQDEGLIKRSANASDRRSHYVQLTAAGRRLAQRLQKEEGAFIRATFGARNQRELDQMVGALRHLEEQASTVQRNR